MLSIIRCPFDHTCYCTSTIAIAQHQTCPMVMILAPCNSSHSKSMETNECCWYFRIMLRTEDTPYSVLLVPLVKELASILEGNCTVEELQQYKVILSNAILAKKKNELVNAYPWNANVQANGRAKWYHQVLGPTKAKETWYQASYGFSLLM